VRREEQFLGRLVSAAAVALLLVGASGARAQNAAGSSSAAATAAPSAEPAPKSRTARAFASAAPSASGAPAESASAAAEPARSADVPTTPVAASAEPESASASANASAESPPPPIPEPVPAAVVSALPPFASAAPAVPSGMPAPSASVEPPAPVVLAGPEADAMIHDTVVFAIRRDHGNKTMAERAHAASEALDRAVDTPGAEEVRIAHHGETVAIYAGSIPVVELFPEDAEASGYATVDTHAAAVAAHVRDAIAGEKRRSALASAVFSFSLLVFFGLIAFYVLRKVSEVFDRLRQWALDDPDRITGLRFQSQVVVGPAALRGAAYVALILGRWVAQIGVVYVWLVFALSLFQTTRPYTEKLTGFVVTPLSSLTARLAASLPVVVVAAVSFVALFILLRFAQLFFEGVERKQTELSWLPADLAPPTSILVRVGIVITALVFVAPVVTGDEQGTLARAGTVALFALGLSCAPLLASVIVGALVVYGRRVRVGQHADIGGASGKVLAVGLVDVRLLDADGCEIRVPHLLSLVRPTRLLGARPRVVVELAVGPDVALGEVQRMLLDAASAFGERPVVELAHIDRDAATFRVVVSAPPGASTSDARIVLCEALSRAGVALGRASERKVRSA
jgi:small-conductance mechanosensitive channel